MIIYVIIAIAIFLISLLFESVRDVYSSILDFIGELLGDALGDFGDSLFYVISFEWITDIPDFFGSMFEGMTEISVYGIGFGALGTILIYFTRDYMITPFVQYYDPFMRTFWTITTFATVFIGGYLMGKYFENTA
jgi:hypothetical protein